MKNRKYQRTRRWLTYLTFGGMLLGATPAGCDPAVSELGAGLFAGISSSIVNQFISDAIAGFFNTSSGNLF